MRKHLIEKFKEILEQEKIMNIEDISMFYNMKGHWVLSYFYEGKRYIISIEEV